MSTSAPDGPHAIRDGYYDPTNPSADQTAGFVRFLNDCANGHGYLEGKMGWVVDANAAVTAPVCETLVVEGINVRRGPAYLQGGSRILINNDLPFGAVPFMTPLIDLSTVSRVTWKGVPLVRGKPTYATKGGGIVPSRVAGLRVGGSHHIENTSIGGVSAPFLDGRGTTNPTGFDHSEMINVATDSCACSIHLVPGANAAGDQQFEDCDFGGSQAAWRMAQSASSGLVGDSFTRVGSYAPLSFDVYDDGSGKSGGQLGSDVLTSFSGEFNYSGIYRDQAGLSSVGGDIWTPGFYQSPSSNLLGWGQDCTIVSNSGTTLVVTPPAGFEFRYGMVLINAATDPLGSSPLATVTSIDEPWPYSADNQTFQATLHLDHAISSPVGTVLHIMQPHEGTIVAGGIAMEKIQGGLMRGPTGKPVFVAKRSNVHDVMIEDWGSAKALEAVAPIFGGKVGTGNWAGYEGNSVRLGFGVMGTGLSAGYGEFVCGRVQTNLRRYDGSAPALGVVLRSAGVGSLGSFGYQRKASDRNTTAPCFNHTASVIPAFSFVKPDPATGGILPTTPTDPAAVGIVGQTAVPANSAGILQTLWCDTFV